MTEYQYLHYFDVVKTIGKKTESAADLQQRFETIYEEIYEFGETDLISASINKVSPELRKWLKSWGKPEDEEANTMGYRQANMDDDKDTVDELVIDWGRKFKLKTVFEEIDSFNQQHKA